MLIFPLQMYTRLLTLIVYGKNIQTLFFFKIARGISIKDRAIVWEDSEKATEPLQKRSTFLLV